MNGWFGENSGGRTATALTSIKNSVAGSPI